VSFILDQRERLVIQDAINAADSLGIWDDLRTNLSNKLADELRSEMVIKHTNHEFATILQLLNHLASNWDTWVLKRSKTQDNELYGRHIIAKWKETHKYTSNTNTAFLLAYLENLLTLIKDWGHLQRLESGALDAVFDLEVALSRIPKADADAEYKAAVFKAVAAIDLPRGYEECALRRRHNAEYIK